MPSAMAARVADSASSTRCCNSVSSAFVGAPTLMTATLPDSEPMRSVSTSPSMPKVARSSSARNWPTRNAIASAEPAPSMIAVLSAVTRTWRARPSWSSVIDSMLLPEYLLITWPPVMVAMSSSLRSRRSPNPGAFVATHWNTPLTWLCTIIDSAEPSTFSAISSNGRGSRMILSSRGMSSCTLVIFSAAEHDVRVVEDRLEARGVGDQVRRAVAVVVLETLDEIDGHAVVGRVLHGDDAAVTDGVQRPGQDGADHVVVVGRDGRDAGVIGLGLDRVGDLVQVLDQPADGQIDAAFDQHRVAALT